MTGDLLLVRCGGRLVGLPVEHVEETMRPLPCERVPSAPPYVRGVSVVRGLVTPIVELGELVGAERDGSPARLVTVRTGEGRRVGLLVDRVLGVRARGAGLGLHLPPLLAGAERDLVVEIGRLDDHLLTVLDATRVLPEEVLDQLEPSGDGG
jgi:purine-binding chemotaxis protein CheW